MVVEAAFLQISDQVTGYGTVSSVHPFHHPSCAGDCFGSCTGNPRVRVRFGNDASEYIFQSWTELEVHRPDPQPVPEQAAQADDLDDEGQEARW